ncbi:MAG: fasciclin domain-containing protein [Planctomycetes bacterium]|nr:fasciclin domain-containing protein [Planctomycetota bacterium]
MKMFALISMVALSLSLGACSSSEPSGKEVGGGEAPAKKQAKDIVDTAVEAGSFTTLASLLTKAGLVDTLKGDGPFTVFAPTDEAFKKVPAATLEALGKDPEALKRVLTYHVVAGKVMKDQAVKLSSAKMVSGDEAKIELKDGAAYIADSKIVKTDILASNGVIHVVDSVMLPPTK